MLHSLLVPLNNVKGKGDFCAELEIGEPSQLQTLLLDSGSSSLVLSPQHYDASIDQRIEPTTLCQHVKYGVGEWLGPVVSSQITIGTGRHKATIRSAFFAIAEERKANTFVRTSGILGLAYEPLNTAHDLSINTFPWRPECSEKVQSELFLRKVLNSPKKQVNTFFSQCVEQGIVPDQFGFLVHRSSVFHSKNKETSEQLSAHPLNQGMLALGKPHLHTQLHKNDFIHIPLVCDKYYNVNLLGVKVESQAMLTPPPFIEHKSKPSNSNCFVDSGANAILLPESLFTELMQNLAQAVPHQAHLLSAYQQYNGKEVGIPLNNLNLSEWPNIQFTFSGRKGRSDNLILTPYSYWQTHAPECNQASFKITTLPGWQAQTILGLPLMCEYYTIFDRQAGDKGALVFASPRVAPHRLSDVLHHDWQAMQSLCKHFFKRGNKRHNKKQE
jgi:hypothetical protein